MIIIQRFTPYSAAVTSLAVLLIGIFWPLYWLWVAIGLGLIPLLATVIMRQQQWRLEYIGLSASMIILLLGAYSFLLIQENWSLEIVGLGVAVVCFFLFEKNVAVFLFQPSKYIPYSLEHISMYCTMVAAFFSYVSLNMFGQLHLAHLRYLFMIGAGLTAVMVWQSFWIQKIAWKQMWRFIVAISLLMTEVMIAFYFWPVSFIVTGCLLTFILYLTLHLSRHFLMQTLTRRLVIRYSVISLIASLFILVTAQWSYT